MWKKKWYWGTSPVFPMVLMRQRSVAPLLGQYPPPARTRLTGGQRNTCVHEAACFPPERLVNCAHRLPICGRPPYPLSSLLRAVTVQASHVHRVRGKRLRNDHHRARQPECSPYLFVGRMPVVNSLRVIKSSSTSNLDE